MLEDFIRIMDKEKMYFNDLGNQSNDKNCLLVDLFTYFKIIRNT